MSPYTATLSHHVYFHLLGCVIVLIIMEARKIGELTKKTNDIMVTPLPLLRAVHRKILSI